MFIGKRTEETQQTYTQCFFFKKPLILYLHSTDVHNYTQFKGMYLPHGQLSDGSIQSALARITVRTAACSFTQTKQQNQS